MVKHLYIIAGCNGAGKTTASKTILPKSLLVKEFVNADEIAKGLSPFNPEGVAWVLYDNSQNWGERVAFGGRNIPVKTNDIVKYEKIENYERL